MGEIRTPKSDVLETAIVAGDIGNIVGNANKIADVGGGSGPSAIWLTSIYGIATVAGTLHLFESPDNVSAAFVAYVAGNDRHMLSLYLSVTGDGITLPSGHGIGPITQDLWAISDGTLTANAGEIFITYDEVGQQ